MALNNNTTVEELRRAYADLLGTDEPIPESSLAAIAQDPSYARRLFACRGAPEMLSLVLSHPPTVAPATTTDLIANSGRALARWMGSGFSTVSDEVLRRRLAACQACPDLIAPPSMLQKLTGVGTNDNRVCRFCGCVVERKAKLPNEFCPAAHADDVTLTRWEEPRK